MKKSKRNKTGIKNQKTDMCNRIPIEYQTDSDASNDPLVNDKHFPEFVNDLVRTIIELTVELVAQEEKHSVTVQKLKKKNKKLHKRLTSLLSGLQENLRVNDTQESTQDMFCAEIRYTILDEEGNVHDICDKTFVCASASRFSKSIPGECVRDFPIGTLMCIDNLLPQDTVPKSTAIIAKTSRSSITVISVDRIYENADLTLPENESAEVSRVVCRLLGKTWDREISKEIFNRINSEPVLYTVTLDTMLASSGMNACDAERIEEGN